MTLTWDEIKKAIDKELEGSAKIKEIRISALYFRGVKICFDRAKNAYVILNETKEKS